MNRRQCFHILGIQDAASREEIRRAYLKLAVAWHPDHFPQEGRLRRRAEEKMKLLNLAYRQLMPNGVSAPGRAPHRFLEELRAYARYACSLSMEYTVPGQAFSTRRGVIENISANGLWVCTEPRVPLGKRISLTYTLPGFGDLMDIKGTIVRQLPHGIGIRLGIRHRFQALLHTFIHRLPAP